MSEAFVDFTVPLEGSVVLDRLRIEEEDAVDDGTPVALLLLLFSLSSFEPYPDLMKVRCVMA